MQIPTNPLLDGGEGGGALQPSPDGHSGTQPPPRIVRQYLFPHTFLFPLYVRRTTFCRGNSCRSRFSPVAAALERWPQDGPGGTLPSPFTRPCESSGMCWGSFWCTFAFYFGNACAGLALWLLFHTLFEASHHTAQLARREQGTKKHPCRALLQCRHRPKAFGCGRAQPHHKTLETHSGRTVRTQWSGRMLKQRRRVKKCLFVRGEGRLQITTYVVFSVSVFQNA